MAKAPALGSKYTFLFLLLALFPLSLRSQNETGNAATEQHPPLPYLYFQENKFDLRMIASDDWNQNGQWFTEGTGLASLAGDQQGFSLISTKPVPGSTYEATITLDLTTDGGIYDLYLNASPDALEQREGSFYAFEISNPTFKSGSCTAQARLIEASFGESSTLAASSAPCGHQITYHAVILKNYEFWVYADATLLLTAKTNSNLIGQPGLEAGQFPQEIAS